MSRRKPHSLADRWRRAAQSAVRGYGVAFVTGRPHVEAIHVASGRVLPAPSRSLARALAEAPHIWTVLMSVMWRDEAGRERYEHELLTTAVRYRQASLVEFLNEQHQRLFTRVGDVELVGAGWIAIPEKTDISGTYADGIYSQLGIWTQ